MTICPRCGRENAREARFCSECGTRLGRSPSQEAEERKIVTALFCDLVGFTARADEADPEDVKALLRPYHARIQREIQAFGGTLDKFIGDGVLGVFGAPSAHEDDPERAVRAALAIQDAMADLNAERPGMDLAARVGVTTGEAVVAVGPVRPSVGESVTGEVVGTAAWLQSAAPPGGIAVAEQTYRACRDRFFWEELAPVPPKGSGSPLAIWQPTEPRGRYGIDVRDAPDTAFVGRDVEVAMLIGVFQRAVRESSPQLVTVTGEPGVGKSRLIAELFAYLSGQLDSLETWRQGRCLPYGEGVTFWALSEIVKAQAGILESDTPEVAAAKLDAAVDGVVDDVSDREWIAARMAPLVGAPSADPGGADHMESFTAWRRFFEALAMERPLILVFEDLHWADQAMLEFIDHLVEWGTQVRMLIVCAGRPELYERRPGWGGGKRNSTTISLAPLSDQETARLLSALLHQAVLPAETQSTLLARAGGNPLYAEEFARMLTDRGVLGGAGGTITASRTGPIPVPDTLQALIASRLDTLAPDRKALLHDAAVVGEVFWASTLASMSGRPEDEVLAGLHEIARKELVRPARSSSVQGQAEFAFWHPLVREVAYGQIPRATRGTKHRAAADWLRRVGGERVSDHAELLAYHYGVALSLAVAQGDVALEHELQPTAARFLVMAGDRAKPLDVRRAGSFYRQALELLPPGQIERARAQMKAAEVAVADGRLGDAERLYAEAIGTFRSSDDPLGLGEAIAMRARTVYRIGENRQAESLMREAIELLESQPEGPELGRVYSRAAGIHLGEDNRRCLELAERAVQIAERFGMQDELVRARQFRGAARCELGDPDGMQDLREAIRLGLELGLGEETAIAHGNLALQLWLWKGSAPALPEWNRMTELAEARGFELQAMWGRAGALEVLFDLGEWDELVRTADRVIAWDRERGRSQLGAFAQIYVANVQIRRGLVAEAAELTREFVPEIRRMSYAEFVAPALMVSLLVEDARGDQAAARAVADEFVATTQDQLGFRLQYLSPVLRVLLSTGMPSEQAEGLIPPPPHAEPIRHAYSRLLCRAVVAETTGDQAVAAELYREAAERWGAYGFVLGRALSLLGLARNLAALDSGAEAAEPADEARVLFDSLGAWPLAHDAAALTGVDEPLSSSSS